MDFSCFFLPNIRDKNAQKTIRGSAIIETSTLNHKNDIIQDVVVVQILAPIIAHIAHHRSIKLAHTKPSIITVIIVLLCETPEARAPEKIHLSGVLTVLRRNLFIVILEACFIQSENI
jgi:hypothetical protein